MLFLGLLVSNSISFYVPIRQIVERYATPLKLRDVSTFVIGFNYGILLSLCYKLSPPGILLQLLHPWAVIFRCLNLPQLIHRSRQRPQRHIDR